MAWQAKTDRATIRLALSVTSTSWTKATGSTAWVIASRAHHPGLS